MLHKINNINNETNPFSVIPSISFWSVPAIVLRRVPRGFLERERRLTESVLLLSFASSIACKPLWTCGWLTIEAFTTGVHFDDLRGISKINHWIDWRSECKPWIRLTFVLTSDIAPRAMAVGGRVERPYPPRISCCCYLSWRYHRSCRMMYSVEWKRHFDQPPMCYAICATCSRGRLLNLQSPRSMSICVIPPQQRANQNQ
jgi:hypothetical protein